ncbi:hypothetical protein B0H21DRAFT_529688, partial [Amylocystis lapponica]
LGCRDWTADPGSTQGPYWLCFSVAFSPDGKHIVSGSADETIRVWDVDVSSMSSDSYVDPGSHSPLIHPPTVDSDHSAKKIRTNFDLHNGWILGENQELLLWIPPIYRKGLWHPRNTLIIGTAITKLDFSHFVHGTSWVKCHSNAK